MITRKLCGIGLAGVAAIFVSTQAHATSVTEGFEGSSYDLFTTSGADTAEISTAQQHSGSQSLYLSLPTGSDYARVKLPQSGFTLSGITSADYWVDRVSANTSHYEAPYLIVGLNCPTCGYGSDDIIAIMWNPGDIGIFPPLNQWSDISVDPSSTLFHLYDNTTGTNLLTDVTLDDLDGVWGDATVSYVDIALGLGGSDGVTASYYVDDLTLNVANTPLPAALPLFASGAGVFGMLGWRTRRKRKATA